jgi:long-chain acyl-CoA synthetase
LKNLVCFDSFTESQKEEASKVGLSLIAYGDVLKEGEKKESIAFEEPGPDTIYIFCYTSGTTGDPKGSMIAHSYFVGCAVAMEHYDYKFSCMDTVISYLPYAHIFEQAMFVFSIFMGIKIGYYQGNPLLLFDDINALKPSILISVPRILNRIHSKVMEEIGRKGKCA